MAFATFAFGVEVFGVFVVILVTSGVSDRDGSVMLEMQRRDDIRRGRASVRKVHFILTHPGEALS